MEIVLKWGVGQLVFGMKEADVTAILGKPDKKFIDEEENVIVLYNQHKLRLTFYEDEDFKLGYMISSNEDLSLFGSKIVGEPIGNIKDKLEQHGLKKWEQEDFDLAENHFNEENWLILQSEFGNIAKVELGAVINDKDEFEFKFKK